MNPIYQVLFVNLHLECRNMSRSLLKSKFLKEIWPRKGSSNPNRLDEMPRNRPSKFISCRCRSIKVEWVQQHCTTWGHRPVKNGHSRISGIVRQKVKEEIRREIIDQMQE